MGDMGNERALKRNAIIDIMRFLFCFLIINYHLFSHFFRNIDYPNYFIRSYMGDEFFFIVSGYYLTYNAIIARDDSLKYSIKMLSSRIRKIAISYYVTWFLCFVGGIITSTVFGESRNLLQDLINSIYELLFLEMFGFKKGLYSNDVGWFFSALLIVSCIICPLLVKYKRKFALYVAPLTALFSYGILSLSFDYLHDPYLLIPNSFVLKGIIRALAAICVGSFLCGLTKSECFENIIHKITRKEKWIIIIFDILLWSGIVYYMIYPFHSNADVLQIQYDYIIVIIMSIALIPIFCNILPTRGKIDTLAKILGKYAFFAYFGQAVVYSIDKLIFQMNTGVMRKALILNISVPVITSILWVTNHLLNRKRKSTT